MKRRNRVRSSEEAPQAPGELRLVQAFVNTVDTWTGAEDFSSLDGLADWLSSRGLLAPGEELEEADLERAVAVREDLRRVLAAHGAAEIDGEAVARLDRATSEGRFRLRVGREGVRLELLPGEADGFGACVGRLLGIVLEAQFSPHWTRLKVCEDPDCRTAFYDTQKNRTGKWCTRRCGSRQRVRTYRRGPKYEVIRKFYRRR